MIHLPQPPDTFTTLQIPCVACNEVFTIAEAYQTATNRWRIPPDHQPAVQMRYEADRTRQPIFTARADPQIDPLLFGQRQQDTYINCPRCGADNRNWLQINGPPPVPIGCALKFFLPKGAIVWQQKFPGAFLSIIVATVLAPLTLLMAMAVQDSLTWGFILAGAVVLAALFTAADLTRDWMGLRLDGHIRRIMPVKQRSQEAKLWQRGILIIVLLGFIMPIIFFQVAPRALGFVSRLLRDTPKTAVQTGNQRLSQIEQDYNQQSVDTIEEAIQSIQEIEKDKDLGSVQIEADITAVLDDLQTKLEVQNLFFTGLVQKDINEQMQTLEAYVAESERLIDERRLEADAKALADISADFRTIGLWWLMVGLSAFVSVFMTMRSLKTHVESIDGMLPRPIFSSVADMTRVTIWEAKRSLQIDGDMSHIQWIEATRNGTGGIDLIGLCRAAPEVDSEGNPLSRTVRAQRYVIQTNMWGRILRTVVRDVRVPPAHNPPPLTINVPNPPQEPVPSEQPYALGDNLAYNFFNESTQTSQPVEVKTAVLHSTKTAHNQTAVPLIRAKVISQSQPAEARKEQLCQEFARILNQLLEEDEAIEKEELGRLYEGLGLDYGRFPGTLLEKCQDLITFYQRRQRLPELVDICICRHREVLWGDIFDLLDE